ncbi:hypothetical protein LINPERHAP1_LOCUS14230 [Linum perenne]
MHTSQQFTTYSFNEVITHTKQHSITVHPSTQVATTSIHQSLNTSHFSSQVKPI